MACAAAAREIAIQVRQVSFDAGKVREGHEPLPRDGPDTRWEGAARAQHTQLERESPSVERAPLMPDELDVGFAEFSSREVIVRPHDVPQSPCSVLLQ